MPKCFNCGKIVDKTIYNYTSKRVCTSCVPLVQELHINNIEITKAGPIMVEPFSCADEKIGRQKFIDFLHLIFDKVNPAAYRLMNSYRKKGYTWLGMIRAIEYFYIIKKNSKQKSNNNIGIIPYVYNDAQKFYEYQNIQVLEKAKNWYNSKDTTTEKIVIEKEEKRKNAQIDMSDI